MALQAKPWALKYPNHVIAMNEILRVYPDARFFMTHRDTLQSLASIAKMSFKLCGMRAAGPVENRRAGRHMLHAPGRAHHGLRRPAGGAAHGPRRLRADPLRRSATRAEDLLTSRLAA